MSNWKEWFHFTRKERIGVIALVVLILAGLLLPLVFEASFPQPDQEMAEAIRSRLAAIRQQKANANADRLRAHNDGRDSNYTGRSYRKPIVTYFPFDPNTITTAEWSKLGVRDRTIQTIQKYLAGGGRFRRAEDLYKIYGLKKEEVDQLIPYVRIQQQERPSTARQQTVFKKKFTPAILDINIADAAAFESLPGIGPKLARRIVQFRDKLGGFYSVEQLGETYGLADTVFQKIKPRLQCGAATVRKLDINTADEQMLSQHPYIGRNLARLMVRYREQHGRYAKAEDLQRIAIVTAEVYNKISVYLKVE